MKTIQISLLALALTAVALRAQEPARSFQQALDRKDRAAIQATARQLIAAVRQQPNRPPLAWELNRAAEKVRWATADYATVHELATAALDLARTGNYLAQNLELFWWAADSAKLLRHFQDELRLGREWVALAEEAGDRAQIVRASFACTDAHWNLDQLDQGLAVLRKAIAVARESGDLRAAGFLLLRAAGTYRRVGDLKTMMRFLSEALEVTRQAQDPGALAEAAGQLALAQINYGDRAAGAVLLDEAEQAAAKLVRSASGAIALAHVASGHYRLGRYERAASVAREALAHAVHSRTQGQQCHAASTLLRALVKVGQPDEARKVGEEYIADLSREPAVQLGFEERRGLSDLSEALADLCAEQRDFEAALSYQKLTTRVRNIDTEFRHTALLAQANARVEAAQQEEKIHSLQLDQQMQRLALASERNRAAALEQIERTRALELAHSQRMKWAAATIALLALGLLAVNLQRVRAQRKTAALLRAQNEQLRQLNIEKDEFLAIAAHDLKSPLGGIQRACEIIGDPQTDVAFVRELGRDMAQSAARMFHLVTRLLDLHRVGQEEELAPCNVTELARSLQAEAQPKAAAKQIALELCVPDEAVRALGDPVRLSQIIDNLLSNALKFSPPGKRVTLTVSADDAGPWLAVADEGPGISAEDQAQLFQKFTRLSARPTAGEHSSGLGLAIVHAQVAALGGSIACESEPGRGTRFVVRLQPARPAPLLPQRAAA